MRISILITFLIFCFVPSTWAQTITPDFDLSQSTDESENVEADSSDEASGNESDTDEALTQYFELDLGASLLFFPHNSFRHAYRDAAYRPGLRAAVSYTIERFRLELGYSYFEFRRSNAPIIGITTFDDFLLFIWRRFDKHRRSENFPDREADFQAGARHHDHVIRRV